MAEPSPQRVAVIDVVGLTRRLIGEHTPRLRSYLNDDGAHYVPIKPVLPAVTTTAQTTYITGKYATEHGIVGNGWYDREACEVKFWKQSNKLVKSEKVWDVARSLDPKFTVASTFWWYNMYTTADYSVTPRPCYPADGLKVPDIYAYPAGLRDELQLELGQFPLFNFWGPKTTRAASDWIASCARRLEERFEPTLQMVYIPHLDYCLMRDGADANDVAKDLAEVDDIVMDLVEFLEARDIHVILLSEYGITNVSRPIHINRVLRSEDMLAIRMELGRELLDAGASRAFAVADHQIAHVYVNDHTALPHVAELLRGVEGISAVLDEAGKREYHIDHERAGDLVCIAERDAWFTYYYWEDDAVAPDFARCVDIHRKPGFDPCELFIDPQLRLPTMKAAYKLLRKSLGFRYLLDLIPLDASLVRGSHGHLTDKADEGPMLATRQKDLLGGKEVLEAIDVHDLILRHLKLKDI